MIPLAGPTAIVGGLLLGAYLIPMAVNGYNNMVETSAINREAAARNDEARKWQAVIAENNAVAQRASESLREGFREKENEYLERLNEQARTIEQRMATDPFNAGNDLHRRFYDVLCKIASGRDFGAREACGVLAAQTFIPGSSPVLSITPETVEQWQQLCEDGRKDFCKYRIVGFRTGPTYDLLAWLTQLDTTLQTYDANDDIIRGQIQQILDMPDPVVDTR
jgi:hypothetical protein